MRDRNDPVGRFEEDPSAQAVDDLAIGSERESLSRWRRTGYIPAQVLESFALVGLHEDLGVHREAVDVAAQLAGDRQRLDLAAAAEPCDRAAAFPAQGDASLDRGGAELGEQGLVGLVLWCLIAVGVARQVTGALQVAGDAALEPACELLDVLSRSRAKALP